MSIYMNNFYFPIKLLKSGFVAKVKWPQEPGFGMMHHLCDLVGQNQSHGTIFP